VRGIRAKKINYKKKRLLERCPGIVFTLLSFERGGHAIYVELGKNFLG
jgi:hypothetical protein